MSNESHLLREQGVLKRIPISRSSWWAGVKAGKYPSPIKLGPKTTAWFASDIDALINELRASSEGGVQ